jgi:hypothetical protein
MISLYLPGMPAALAWPQEWMMVIAWFGAGSLLYFYPKKAVGSKAFRTLDEKS